ncbi:MULTISPECIES: hypothetical protein [Gordonia]|uniref:Uncharacterized protein n=1 Tax=Gordonia amicalis TaxID=89053 RepID=A0AAE4R1A4_9ACTN|nr:MULTISPECIES: hypothetical protein [Gordonia]MCZ4577772.1 hypothetical protein [Gordonia amicalis]MCZ4652392.1 hypothetical protein [Gordonia amicalis]MDJ0451233.1 hypothetical protein [Gordonia amicalis]MDV6310596.1 hypothetical protein [Gordonia amicalis]MDV7074615.1 hypothetical protein [Gordonia amicalis]
MTRGEGPRRQRDVERQEARRAQFAEYCDRQMRDPTAGTTWHPEYQWPSESDETYAARRRTETTHPQQTDTNNGHPAGK